MDHGAVISHRRIPGSEVLQRKGAEQVHHILAGLPLVDLIPRTTVLGGVGLDERSRHGRDGGRQIIVGIRRSCREGRRATERSRCPGRGFRQGHRPRGEVEAERALWLHAHTYPPPGEEQVTVSGEIGIPVHSAGGVSRTALTSKDTVYSQIVHGDQTV